MHSYFENTHMCLVKANNQHAKRMGWIASNVIKLGSSRTGLYLVSELSWFGRINHENNKKSKPPNLKSLRLGGKTWKIYKTLWSKQVYSENLML